MSHRTRINLVKQIYQDPADPGGFSSPFRVWTRAILQDPTITLADVTSILKDEDTYTLHRRIKKVKKTRRYLTSGLNHYFQIDLFVLNETMTRVNDKRYILFCIDSFSRKLFARALKTKSGAEVATALKSIIKENDNIPPKYIVSDKGKEWLNHRVKALFDSYNIVHITTENVYHAGLVERVIRTMREKFGRYMTHYQTNVFIPKLKDFVAAYNQTPHSALPKDMSPNRVNKKNEFAVWRYQFASHFRRAPQFYGPSRLKVGDIVRITSYEKTFKKSSDITFTREKFVITHVLATTPRTYKIASLLQGDAIEGVFYREELQFVGKKALGEMKSLG